jgi:hypothetical protein
MINYAATAQAAFAALKSAGALVTIDWTVAPDYDPAAPATAPTPRSITTYGAFVPYQAHKVGTQGDSLIRAGDRNLLLAAIDDAGAALPEPPPGARITAANGETWRVANAEALRPAADVVLFDITARR